MLSAISFLTKPAAAQQKSLNKTVWKVEQILPDGTVQLSKLDWRAHESISGDYEYSFIQFRSPKAYLIVLECYGEMGQLKFWEGNQIDFISKEIKTRKECEEDEVIEGSYFYAIKGEELTLIPLAQKKAPKQFSEPAIEEPQKERSFLEVGSQEEYEDEVEDISEEPEAEEVRGAKEQIQKPRKENEMRLPQKVIDKLEERKSNNK
jgi:hypothetical protein